MDHVASSILVAGSGFLLAVLWMDLMFDAQVLKFRHPGLELPEPVLASISAYYRRVTTSAKPMGHFVGVVMLITLITLTAQLILDQDRRWLALASLPFCFGPIFLAILRVYPNAVKLANGPNTKAQQSALAVSICRDHLVCFISIFLFMVIQVLAA